MPVVNDVLECKVFANTLARQQNMLNVYYYRVLDMGGVPGVDQASEDFAQIFEDVVIAAWRDIVSVSIETTGIEVQFLNDITDYHAGLVGALPKPIVGTRAGSETMPLANTWTFRLNRANPPLRSGFKRYSGMVEGDIQGPAAAPGIFANLAAMSAALEQDLIDFPGRTYTPVIAKRPIVLGANPTNSLPGSVSFAGVGSQVSRKQSFVA